MEKKLIQQIIIPLLVAGLVVLLSIKKPCTELDFFLVFILPISPIIYGLITKNKIGSILLT